MKRVLMVCIAVFAMQTFATNYLSAQIITSANIIRIKDNSKQEEKERKKQEEAKKKQLAKEKQKYKKQEKEQTAKQKQERKQQAIAEKKQFTKEEQEKKQLADAEKKRLVKEEQEQEQQKKLAKREANKALLLEPIKKGVKYGQFVDISYTYNGLGDFVGVNYIGGCRINELFFIGVGTGVNICPDPNKTIWRNNIQIGRIDTINIPVYAHFRVDFMRTNWAPFAAISAGYRLAFKEQHYYSTALYQNGPLGDISIGVNRRITNKLSLYLGAGYRIESFWGINNKAKLMFFHGASVHLGLKF